jgi:hypothetical protein
LGDLATFGAGTAGLFGGAMFVLTTVAMGLLVIGDTALSGFDAWIGDAGAEADGDEAVGDVAVGDVAVGDVSGV